MVQSIVILPKPGALNPSLQALTIHKRTDSRKRVCQLQKEFFVSHQTGKTLYYVAVFNRIIHTLCVTRNSQKEELFIVEENTIMYHLRVISVVISYVLFLQYYHFITLTDSPSVRTMTIYT